MLDESEVDDHSPRCPTIHEVEEGGSERLDPGIVIQFVDQRGQDHHVLDQLAAQELRELPEVEPLEAVERAGLVFRDRLGGSARRRIRNRRSSRGRGRRGRSSLVTDADGEDEPGRVDLDPVAVAERRGAVSERARPLRIEPLVLPRSRNSARPLATSMLAWTRLTLGEWSRRWQPGSRPIRNRSPTSGIDRPLARPSTTMRAIECPSAIGKSSRSISYGPTSRRASSSRVRSSTTRASAPVSSERIETGSGVTIAGPGQGDAIAASSFENASIEGIKAAIAAISGRRLLARSRPPGVAEHSPGGAEDRQARTGSKAARPPRN